MTRAVLFTDASGRYTGYAIKGHSGYAEEGSDVVCAAVSVLAITVCNALETLLKLPIEQKGGEDGYIEVRLPKTMEDGPKEGAQLLMDTLALGLTQIQEAYPRHFNLKSRRSR